MITATVRVERIAAGGEGVGRLDDGRVVFIPRTAPNEVVLAEVSEVRRRYARGRLLRVLEPSEERIVPPCPHYTEDECGGCQLQHLTVGAQREARRGILADALSRIGKLAVPVPPVEPALREWHYRAKLTLTKGADGSIGLHRLGGPGKVFPLRDCPLAEQPIGELWARIRGVVERLPKDLTRLVLRLARDGRRHLVVETKSARRWAPPGELVEAGGLPNEAPVIVWWRPVGGDAHPVAGDPGPYPATAFEQVNPAMGDKVRDHLIDALGELTGRQAWDLYAGVGETSLLMARAGAFVTSVEWSAGAVEEAGRRHREAEVSVERVSAAVEDAVGDLPAPAIVVANPPRVGMSGPVIEAIRRRGPARLGYVSCDPATLARDLGLLTKSGPGSHYRVSAVQGFDLFPQTAHVESVAILERA